MKKISILFAMSALGLTLTAQDRLVLVEEFTQASCPPCASQNPAFDALMGVNETKAVRLKYQTSWPGVDPMNAQNPTDVATRRAVYGVSSVPNVIMDGNVFQGAPSGVTQSSINTRQAVTSPFNITLSHSFDASYSNLTVDYTITNASGAAYTANDLKLHVALVEKKIEFANAPGTNGETDFYYVMRQMLPDADGSSLQASWTASQAFTDAQSIAVPSYIYDLDEMAVVAFIQRTGSKEVLQAAFSDALISGALNAQIASSSNNSDLCGNGEVTPSIDITNHGPGDLTSLDLEYTVNGSTMPNTWTGTLAQGATVSHTLPQVTFDEGVQSLLVEIKESNGKKDRKAGDNIDGFVNLRQWATVNTPTYLLDFESSTSLERPEGLLYTGAYSSRTLVIEKANVNGLTNEIGASGNSTKSLFINFFGIPKTEKVEYITQKVDASALTSPSFGFNHAFAKYDATSNDKLEISYSKDCGATWTTFFSQSGDALKTKTDLVGGNSQFFPAATEWTFSQYSLAGLAGESEVMFKIAATSDFGNNLFLDNIAFGESNTVSLDENKENAYSIYPNPTNNVIRFSNENLTNENVVITDVLGKEVKRAILGSNLTLNVSDLNTGVYLVNVNGQSTRLVIE